MKLTSRVAVEGDFAAFFENCYHKDRENAPLRAAVGHEWRVLLENCATLSMVAEEDRPAGRRLVGCAQMAFVTPTFAQWAMCAPTPGANVQATHRLPDGSWPLRTGDEVAEANAGAGLHALFTRWARADALLSREQGMALGRFMHDAFLNRTRGYKFCEILVDVIGEPARAQALRAGFAERNCYASHFARHPTPPESRPFLMGINRAEAFDKEGCLMGHYFIYSPPRFGFAPKEQRLLSLCQTLQDSSDEALAQALTVPLFTVKNSWRSIYRRVMDIDPDLLPLPEGKARGIEKKRRLLQYLREHPEEVRPYQPRREKESNVSANTFEA